MDVRWMSDGCQKEACDGTHYTVGASFPIAEIHDHRKIFRCNQNHVVLLDFRMESESVSESVSGSIILQNVRVGIAKVYEGYQNVRFSVHETASR